MLYRLLTTLWLIFSLPLWSACTSSGDATVESIPTEITESATVQIFPTVTEIPDPTDIPATATEPETVESAQITVPDLSESYAGENELVNASLSVNYPAGWTAQGTGTQLLLASEDPDSITADSEAILINIAPIGSEMLDSSTDVESLVAQSMRDTFGQEVEVMSTTLNDILAAYAITNFEDNNALVYALQFGENFVILTALKSQAFTENDEALIIAIAESIVYDAGEIPQGDE